VIVFRCDICGKEVRLFWNIAVTRKRCEGNEQSVLEKAVAFDVCSLKCEQAAVSQILSIVVPIVLPTDGKEPSHE
jgi:hypothetical protein